MRNKKRLLESPPAWWAVLVFTLLVWGGQMARRGLWEPDEARFAYVAVEMRDSGSWLIPRRHGEIYAEKPPLMFWLINAGAYATASKIGPLTVRLPSLFGAWLTLLAASRLLARWRDAQAAWLVLPLLSGAWLFWQTCGMGQIDALLLGLEMSALYLLFTWDPGDSCAGVRWRPYAAGLCMGLAMLAKGPVGLLVPLGAWVCATFASGDRRPLSRLPWTGLVGLALLPALLWLAAARLTGAPDSYFHAILFEQNLKRAAGALGHRRGFLYFFWHAPLEFMPWTLLLPSAWLALEDSSETRRLRRRLAAWAGWVLFFFTLSASKRNLYVLPAFPAAAMLIAAAGDKLRERHWVARLCLGLSAAIGIFIFCVMAWPSLPSELDADTFHLAGCVMGTLSLGWFVWASWWILDRPKRLLPAFILLWVTLLAMAGAWMMPLLNPFKTPVALAQAAREHLPAGQPLLIYDMHGEILALYTGGRGERVNTPAALQRAMQRQKRGLLAFHSSNWAVIKPLLPAESRVEPFDMGKKHLVWAAFDLEPKH